MNAWHHIVRRIAGGLDVRNINGTVFWIPMTRVVKTDGRRVLVSF